MRLLASFALALATLGAASAAEAQIAATSRPPVRWIGLGRPGDTTGSDGHGDRIGELALEPLRLALLGDHPPYSTLQPGCGDDPSAIGRLTGGAMTASQGLLAMNLVRPRSWRTPRLTLFGFSRVGCPLDSAGGGGLTFTVPVRQDVFFVLSAGAIYLPHGGPGGSAVASSQARADIVLRRTGGRSLSVGIGTVRGGPSVSLGGVF